MTREELITQQQLELEEFRRKSINNKEVRQKLLGKIFGIGQPMNDNKMKMNNDQLSWVAGVWELIEQLE